MAVEEGKEELVLLFIFIFGLFMSQPMGKVANLSKTDAAQ